MNTLSQDLVQNTSQKKDKIQRKPSEVFSKIIAFQEILTANPERSERSISSFLKVSNSTMQTWQKRDALKEAITNNVDIFFSTPEGQFFLERVVMAGIYNNKCGASGIQGLQEFLSNSGLNRYVASSTGSLQAFWKRCEDSFLKFEEEWKDKLSKQMNEREISIVADEMFSGGKPCLVAIAAVSNYILLEKFTDNRKADTWEQELKVATEGMPVTVNLVVSDLCGALRSMTKSIGAEHSPDLFHGQYELSKATSAALSSQERAAEKVLNEVEEEIKKLKANPSRLNGTEKAKQKERLEELEKRRASLTILHAEKKKRREETGEAKKELGRIYHPINLETGKIQSATVIKKKIKKQFGIIEENAKAAKLNGSCLDRIAKAKRAFALMGDFCRQFFILFLAFVLDMKLSYKNRKFFKEIVFPLAYLKMIWRRLPKKERDKRIKLLKALEGRFKEYPEKDEIKEALMTRGKELAEQFQRSSSCVEGRNGVLSLLLHRFHRLDEKTLRVLTIIHNFGVKRKSDGSTAAERFFGAKHNDLFEHLIENVRIPGRPQVQIRRKQRTAA